MPEYEWISVEDRSPLMHAGCWICHRGVVKQGYQRWDRQWADERGQVISGVTHWMPFWRPDPPEVSDG